MAPSVANRSVSLTLLLCCACVGLVHGISYTMNEEAIVGSYIGNISADSGLKDVVGEDDFANLRYSILSGGSQNSQLFQISAPTGVLTVGDRVDREQLCPYLETCELTLEITAQYESLLRKFSVTIVVLDINDNSPMFPQETIPPFQLSEATSVNFALSLDAATDLDGTRNFSVQNYSLIPTRVPFRVVHTVNAVGVSQLSMVVSEQLDRETRSSYSLTVWAYDGGVPPRSGAVTFTVIVLDVNDNAPEFTQDVYTRTINESTPVGTAVLTVSASDADDGNNARILYSISSQQPEREQEKFDIAESSGVVSVAQTLEAGVHRVLIEAQDQGTPPKPPTQAVVEVTVLDTDNNPPVLNLDMLSVSDLPPGMVPESGKISTAVGYLAVSDPDTGANALVTCSIDDEHFDLQSLNLNEYKVIIRTPLDRESTPRLNVVVVCFDGGSPQLTSTTTFNVTVVDVNDHPPEFLETQYTATVAENNEPGDGLLQVAATDFDEGNNGRVRYRLATEQSMFQIGATNGMIKARGSFDFEDVPRYVFTVLAVDEGEQPLTSTTTVTVIVLDVNDEKPRFTLSNYTMQVSERQQPGVVVGNVTATDRDTDIGGQVTLSIIPQPGLVLPFDLSSAGVLTTTATLDRELRPSYSFYVLARDRGMQPLSSSAHVTVHVLDVNDNAPTFVFTNGNATVDVLIPVSAQHVVANVQAIDPDAGSNGTVRYSVVGGNASNVFRVESVTGAVVTLIPLQRSQLGWYQLLLRATDQGTTQIHTDHNMTIRVGLGTVPGHALGGTGSSEEESDGGQDYYLIIVVCIVVFTAVVSGAVVGTLCVLRKLDRDRKLKYRAACCPSPGAGHSPRDCAGSLYTAPDFHRQVPAVSGGVGSKTNTVGGSLSEPVFGSHLLKGDMGGSKDLLFAQPRSSFRSSQRQSPKWPTAPPVSHPQHSKKTPLQLEVVRRADDFHSTSSAETTTGDSGHGSDEDIANHSHDTPLSPGHPHHHPKPPPRPIRVGGNSNSTSSFSRTRTLSNDSSTPKSAFSSGGPQRGSKQHSSVRFAADVTHLDGRGRYVSTDSIRDDESDLNTTTSGSFSVPPDDLYGDYRQLDMGFATRHGSGRYQGGGSSFSRDMLV